VVGLGNPGRHYSHTRHNAGFSLIRKIAKKWETKPRKRRFLSKATLVEKNQNKILLVMPQTFMNKSGLAVKKILESGLVEPKRLIVIYDDIDIPLGEIRIREEGGAGTHKGMLSIIEEIQTSKFPRIRVGIGPLHPGIEATDYVLSKFEEDQKPKLEKGLTKTEAALELILEGKIKRAMNLYNQRLNHS